MKSHCVWDECNSRFSKGPGSFLKAILKEQNDPRVPVLPLNDHFSNVFLLSMSEIRTAHVTACPCHMLVFIIIERWTSDIVSGSINNKSHHLASPPLSPCQVCYVLAPFGKCNSSEKLGNFWALFSIIRWAPFRITVQTHFIVPSKPACFLLLCTIPQIHQASTHKVNPRDNTQ